MLQALGARRQFVGGDEYRTERAGAVEILADRPLRRLELIVAHRDVVEDRIAGDVVERLTSRDMAAALADHGDELALIVELVGDSRANDRRAVADEARWKRVNSVG